MEQIEEFRKRLERTAFAPLLRTGRMYYLVVAALALIVAWGLYAYFTQIRHGLIVTGMSDRISWGLYISVCIFIIAISYGGTLVSAVLRITNAGWRTPITRIAEFVTVAALAIGALFIIIDMGRPDRLQNLLLYGRWQSPIVWDVLAISTYLVGCIIFLYLPLIPDLARCRDQLGQQVPGWKRWLFSVFSLNWKGSLGQRQHLGIAMAIMMVLIIPLAFSVHTVLSWIFGMTLREPWDSPLFGIYFVTGAVFSGVATVIIIVALFRKIYHLEEYITPKHFSYLGYMLVTLAAAMIYFNLSMYLTTGYKLAGEAAFDLQQLFTGVLAPFYWVYSLGGLVLPILIIAIPWTRTIAGVVVASILVNLGMWLERYNIVVGGLRVPLMPYEPASYAPTWVEWSVMAGGFAAVGLILAIFVKLFPVVAIWEVEEHYEKQSQGADDVTRS